MKKLTVTIFIALSAYLYLDGGCTFNCINKTSFSEIQWAKYEKDIAGNSDRLNMIPDIICNKLKKGMNKDEVITILGKPDSENWSSYYPYLGWSNGKYQGESSDGTGLFIKFNENNKLQDIFSPYWLGTKSYYSSPFGFLKCINI